MLSSRWNCLKQFHRLTLRVPCVPGAHFWHFLCALCAYCAHFERISSIRVLSEYCAHTKFCLCTLVHTCTHCVHLIHTVHTLSTLKYIHLIYSLIVFVAGPLWYDKRTGAVLKASRRYNIRGKTAGDLAASLQLNVWRRAEEPGKLTHELVGGGQNARGFTALENPLW